MMRSDRAKSRCEGATVRQFRIDNKGALLTARTRCGCRPALRRRRGCRAGFRCARDDAPSARPRGGRRARRARRFFPRKNSLHSRKNSLTRSRERSDLDAPAAGYTVASERALARSWLPLWSLLRSFILALRISFCVWIRSVSPSFACSLDGRITSHPVELVGSDHNPSCSRASGSGWRDHSVNRRVSAREFRGHRPPGSGEAAFSFAGVGGVG